MSTRFVISKTLKKFDKICVHDDLAKTFLDPWPKKFLQNLGTTCDPKHYSFILARFMISKILLISWYKMLAWKSFEKIGLGKWSPMIFLSFEQDFWSQKVPHYVDRDCHFKDLFQSLVRSVILNMPPVSWWDVKPGRSINDLA